MEQSQTDTTQREDVSLEVVGRVGSITIARPPVNAFATSTWTALERCLEVARSDASLSVLVIRSGMPMIFSAGADVNELPMTPDVDERRQQLTRHILSSIMRFPVPVLCGVPGPALGGGCALASACDVRFATDTATFGLPEINVGRCGGGRYLMRHLPQGEVRLAYFTGAPISAGSAYRLGFVQRLYGSYQELDDAIRELAAEIASKSPTGLRLAKQSLDLAENLDVLAGYAVEQQFSLRLATTDDAAEAASAFREKRPARWAGI